MPESQRVDLRDAVARSAPATRQRIDFLFESASSTFPTVSDRPATPAADTAISRSTEDWPGTARRRPSRPASTACAWAATFTRAVADHHRARSRTAAIHSGLVPVRHGAAPHGAGQDDRQCGAVAAELRDRAGMAAVTSFEVAGLFAGIGGLELGMAAGGHHTELLVESATPAMHVLRHHFPDTKLERDVRELRSLPSTTDLVVAGSRART